MPVAVQRRDHAGVAHCLDGHLAAAAQVVHHPLAPQLRAAFEVRRCHFLDLAASGGQPGGSLFDGGHRLVPQHAESLFAQAEAATGASLPQNAQGRVRRLPPMRPYWRTVSCACAAPTAARTSGSRCAASVEACSPSCGAGARRRLQRTWRAAPFPMRRCANRDNGAGCGRSAVRLAEAAQSSGVTCTCLCQRPWQPALRQSTGRCRPPKLRLNRQVPCAARPWAGKTAFEFMSSPGRQLGEHAWQVTAPSSASCAFIRSKIDRRRARCGSASRKFCAQGV